MVEQNPAGLTTKQWLDVARETLIRDGVDGVKIDRLAKACGVTRGGFYWRFESREDLLGQLLEDWRLSNTGPFIAALTREGSPQQRFRALFRLWLGEKDFRPDYDAAVRHWALTSPEVAGIVRTVDQIRINALRDLFVEAGYGDEEAYVRARVTYYHQVGYYALRITEQVNLDRLEIYYRVLSGFTDEFSPQEYLTDPAHS